MLLMLLVIVVAPATALADKKEDAKAHIAKATKAHKDGHFDAARLELEAAYALDPKPELLYAIGQMNAKLGKCGEATTYFHRFAASDKDPQVAKVVDQAIAACKSTPEPAKPPPPAGSQSTPDSPPPPADPPAPPAASPTPAQPAPMASRPRPFAPTQPAPSGARQRSPWYKDKLGDGLVLGGIVATVVGIVEYRGAVSDLDAAEDKASAPTVTRYGELVDSAHGKRTASVVLFGAGGALITAGIIRYVLHDRATETRTVGIAPAHGGGLVTYEGSF
jgi:hypothetical protein